MSGNRLVVIRAGLFLGAFLSAAAASAAEPAGNLADNLEACARLKPDAERLACFDSLAGRIIGQVRSGAITIVDQEQVKAVRRQAFGFSVPALTGFFPGGDRAKVEAVETRVERVYRTAGRGWGLRLADGSRWEQTDQESLPRDPKEGDPVVIRRAALGSYLMKVNGMTAFRARRTE